MRLIGIIFIVLLPGLSSAQVKRDNFDAGWKFLLGDDSAARDRDFVDSKWRVLDLPHDWSIEGRFSDKNTTGQQEGGLPAGIGWYRKHFRVAPADKGRMVYVEFDGIYRNSEVWINGHYLGKRPNGYISFRYELGPWLLGSGTNVLAVRVDNSAQPNSRWYTGSGIYRHVRLVTTGPVAVDQWGVAVSTPEVSPQRARVHVVTTLRVAGPAVGQRDQPVTIVNTLYDAMGQPVAADTLHRRPEGALPAFGQDLVLASPRRWSPDHPYLYTLKTRLLVAGRVIDEYTTRTGIRSFRFDARQGLLLNGESLKIRGVCLHHDLGALGAAVNTSAIRRQLQILKDMGCNGIRTAHNPPAPELLDLCDEMGFIVMDEAFDMWRKKKNKYDYSLDFPAWHVRDLQDQVRRDRNHPSVFLWSIGNEIREQFDSTGIPIARELASIVRELDTTRPVTSALTETDTMKNFIYRSGALDLVGLNYNQDKYDSAPEHYPGHPFLATETTSALATRGHYDMPADSIRRWPPGAKKPLTGGNPDWTVSAYDNVSAYWGSTHEETWKVVRKDPFVSGLYVWTGFDYIGEPTPYPWPARSAYFGIVDLAGFPKDAYYMYQSEWTTTPVLHLFPHWNWHQGDTVDVWAYYNQADVVELFLNGHSMGVRSKKGDDLHVSWRVPWQSGTLTAVSRLGGRTVLTRRIRTAGPAAAVELQADRKKISADGTDLAFITIMVQDANGQFVPDAGNELTVTVEGQGVLAGLDNGYQAGLESFQSGTHKAYNGLCLAIVRAKRTAGKIVVHVSGKGLKPASVVLSTQ
jgi:beta-galactosidase